jgi:hypothetical protein
VPLRIKLLSALLSACGLALPGPVELSDIASASDHPTARAFTFTAQVVPSLRGVHAAPGLRHPRAVGAHAPGNMERWVVPLTLPGRDPGKEIHAWVATPHPVAEGTAPDAWLRQLADGLDRKPVTLRVAARAGDRSTRPPWLAPITDAEDRFGLRSHPDAPVFQFGDP